jgi:hypothetical protein
MQINVEIKALCIIDSQSGIHPHVWCIHNLNVRLLKEVSCI